MLAVEPEKSDRRMSIAESERRMSIVEPENKTFAEPEKRAIESEKRMSGVEIERKTSISEPGRRMSIVEHVRRVTEVQNAKEAGNRTTHSLPDPRGTTTEVFSRSRRGSAPMLGGWIDEKQSVIVISDSPELDTADTEMNIPDKSEKLFPERTVPDSTSPVATEGSSRSVDQTTPLAPFGHIWPVPVIDSGKKTRRPKDSEPAPTRSFITPLNLPPPPPTTQVKQLTPVVDDEAKDKDKDKDKEAGSNQPSVLRSMLTTMPPRATFVAAVQNFLSQPATKTRRNRAVIMTKSLMKDALGVLLDPNTDELLKDYVPPEKKKDDEKLDGTRRKMSITIDTTDHTSLEFRAWAKRMFSTVKTTRGEDVLAFDGKPVVVEDDIYETIVICHSQGNHCSTEETAKLVDQEHSWVPRALIEAFVQKCPGCPLENKTISTTTKPKKRKSVRGSSAAAAAAGPKRKPMITRRKKTQDGESLRRSRKSSGKEASPEESDVEEGDQEEDELKESGDEAGPADVKTDDPEPEPAGEDQDQDQDQDEGEPEQEPEPEPDADEPDEAEEPEMESEDELVSRPSPMGRKSGT
ncbi:hypothetical protein OPQ81_002415 [Rhizoctonia solani]|nr:hypothetical protein OPQ81_002415 [Rhizoctonia solani]